MHKYTKKVILSLIKIMGPVDPADIRHSSGWIAMKFLILGKTTAIRSMKCVRGFSSNDRY